MMSLVVAGFIEARDASSSVLDLDQNMPARVACQTFSLGLEMENGVEWAGDRILDGESIASR